MKNLKIKLIISLSVFILMFGILELSIYATNENVQIIKKTNTEYLIYIKDNLNTNFSFAFSNDKNVDPKTLNYTDSASDTIKNANKIAYVNDSNIALFANDTYMWVKNGDEYILKGIKIDLSNSISNGDLNLVEQISKQIKVDLTQVAQTEEIVNDVKIMKTVGKVVLVENGDYKYQMIKSEISQDYSNFIKLADKLAKLNDQTSFYTKIETYHDFNNLYKKLLNELSSENWLKVENNEILQPETTVDGEEYVLWIKNANNLVDVQFLSCTKEISQDKIIETITTKLPVTYDNNTLLIVLGILVLATILVTVRIITIKKVEEK